jgi:hypothetical protein
MGYRRFLVVGAVASATLLTGMANATAAPTSDSGDRRVVEVEANPTAKRAAVDPVASEFIPTYAPTRVLDTRNGTGTGGTTNPVGPGRTVTVDLSRTVPDDATAVVLNVTGTAPTANTFVTVHPGDEARPFTSSLNLTPNQTRANQVTVGLNDSRAVSLFNNVGNTHLIADLVGYYVDRTASLYNAVQPGRVLDTRGGAPIGPWQVRQVSFPWLPDSATTVTLNLTAVNATTHTYIAADPAGLPTMPVASSLNVGPGEEVPNQVTVRLGTDKTVNIFNANGQVHVIADLVGYYATDSGDAFVPISPERVMDTRPGNGLTPDILIALTGWGAETDPIALTGVVGNLTGTNPTAPQYVVVWPGGQPVPNTSNQNLVAGQTAANAVTVGIDYEPLIGDRSVNFANSAGYVDVIFDVSGFFVRFN